MLVIVEAVELFIVPPLAATAGVPVLFEAAVGAAIVAAVIAIVWPSRIAVSAVLVATFIEVLALALRRAHRSERTEALDFAAALILLTALTVVLSIAVFGPGRVTVHRILGAVAIYLNVAAAFALAYRLADAVHQGSFSPATIERAPHAISTLVYFSFATLTTSAYGDIVPVDPFVRSAANLESVIGQLFPATLLARLVTLQLQGRAPDNG